MHKLFDKTLASRLGEVFENHQEAYRPDDWEKLRTKMSQQKNGRVIFLSYLAKAASVAILIGLSVFSLNEPAKKEFNVTEPEIASTSQLNISPETNTNSAVSAKNSNISKSLNKKSVNQSLKNDKKLSDSIEKQINKILIASTVTNQNIDTTGSRFANVKKELENHRNEIKKMGNNKIDTSGRNLIVDDTEFDFVENKNTNKRFDVGLEVASVSNYAAEGNGSNFNVGAGISAAWHISKNISFSSGMIIARQSMDYNKSESSNILLQNKSADFASGNSLEMVDVNTAESTLEFIGIDIPLNVQLRHKKFILTTGVSSIVYIQENFNYSYNSMVTNTVYNLSSNRYETQSDVNQVSEQEKSGLFDHFDFARLVNIAIGYNIPLSRGELIIEPYVKLPVGNISSYQVKMGSGGFAIKYFF